MAIIIEEDTSTKFIRSAKESPEARFKISSPFEGNIIPRSEFFDISKKYYIANNELSPEESSELEEMYTAQITYEEDNYMIIIPTTGIAKAPFNGTIVMDSDLRQSIRICADNGVDVYISIGDGSEEYNFETTVCKVNKGDVVKKGDILFEFNLEQLKQSGPNIPYVEILIGDVSDFVNSTFTLLDKSNITFGDTIIEFDGAPLSNAQVKEKIKGFDWGAGLDELDTQIETTINMIDKSQEYMNALNSTLAQVNVDELIMEFDMAEQNKTKNGFLSKVGKFIVEKGPDIVAGFLEMGAKSIDSMSDKELECRMIDSGKSVDEYRDIAARAHEFAERRKNKNSSQ